MSRDLPKNLRLLCSYHRSIAEVCRNLGVNRSQFNRYLSGETFPSLRLMRRMCDFFGVEETEILMPHGQFSELLRLKPNEASATVERNVVATIANDVRTGSRASLDPYVGYYFTYYNSMSHPGLVLRALTRIFRTPHGVNVKSIESVGRPGAHKFTCKYEGGCFMLGDRIFMTVMETLTRNEVMQIVLYPSYNNRVHYLSGVVSGVAARAPRPPSAALIVLHALGDKPNLRQAMRKCALFDPDDPEIPEDIRRMLATGPRADGRLLEAPAG